MSGSADSTLPTVEDIERTKEALERQSVTSVSEKPKAINYDQTHSFPKLYKQGLEHSHGGRHGEAIDVYRQALEIATKDGGPDCLEVAAVNIAMARTYAKTANPAVALELASAGVPTYAKYWGTESKAYGEAAYEMAMYYALLKKPSDALDLLHQCRPSFTRHFGVQHPKTMQLFTMIAMLKNKKS